MCRGWLLVEPRTQARLAWSVPRATLTCVTSRNSPRNSHLLSDWVEDGLSNSVCKNCHIKVMTKIISDLERLMNDVYIDTKHAGRILVIFLKPIMPFTQYRLETHANDKKSSISKQYEKRAEVFSKKIFSLPESVIFAYYDDISTFLNRVSFSL